MASKKPKKENSFADLVARLNAMSNMTKEKNVHLLWKRLDKSQEY